MKNTYFACRLETPTGHVWYSFGQDHLADGLTDNDNYDILPCSSNAYQKACEGDWAHICVKGGKVMVGAGSSENSNPPVVHAIIQGRDF